MVKPLMVVLVVLFALLSFTDGFGIRLALADSVATRRLVSFCPETRVLHLRGGGGVLSTLKGARMSAAPNVPKIIIAGATWRGARQ